jgi:hypothetical protein
MDIRNSVLYESDVNFGSAQDAAHELPAEQMIELLRGEPIMYKVVDSFENGSDSGSVCLEYGYRTEDGSSVRMNKLFESSELPSGIKTGDKLRYSLNDGWEKTSD